MAGPGGHRQPCRRQTVRASQSIQLSHKGFDFGRCNSGRNAQRPEHKGLGFAWESPADLLFHGNVVYYPRGLLGLIV
jgi:hypothetical protein